MRSFPEPSWLCLKADHWQTQAPSGPPAAQVHLNQLLRIPRQSRSRKAHALSRVAPSMDSPQPPKPPPCSPASRWCRQRSSPTACSSTPTMPMNSLQRQQPDLTCLKPRCSQKTQLPFGFKETPIFHSKAASSPPALLEAVAHRSTSPRILRSPSTLVPRLAAQPPRSVPTSLILGTPQASSSEVRDPTQAREPEWMSEQTA